MNKWLERALISAGAAVVSTTAIVTTAERPGKRKKRKKKKGEDSRGKDGALVDDEVPRSVGAQAAHDYRVGHDGGLTAREWLANVRDAGKNAASRVSTVGGYLIGRQQPPPPEGDGEGAELDEARAPRPKAKRKKVRRRVRRKVGEGPREPATAKKKRAGGQKVRQKKGSARRGEEPVDEIRELRDEAVKRAASAAAKHAADKSGLGGAARQIKESGEELWKKTEQLGKAVKDRVPEDLGERASATLGEAGKGIARGARALSERLRTALSEEQAREERDVSAPPDVAEEHAPNVEEDGAARHEPTVKEPDLGDRLGRGIKGVARWMEGPGAPRDDDGPSAPRRTRPAVPEDDVVEAKDPDAAPPDVVEAKDPDDDAPL